MAARTWSRKWNQSLSVLMAGVSRPASPLREGAGGRGGPRKRSRTPGAWRTAPAESDAFLGSAPNGTQALPAVVPRATLKVCGSSTFPGQRPGIGGTAAGPPSASGVLETHIHCNRAQQPLNNSQGGFITFLSSCAVSASRSDPRATLASGELSPELPEGGRERSAFFQGGDTPASAAVSQLSPREGGNRRLSGSRRAPAS